MTDPHGELTAEQRSVVEAGIDARLLVIAGAGTGKTHTLIRRLSHLVDHDGASPGQGLLVLSFTRAAVKELRDRTRLAESEAAYVRAVTFDSFATRLLSRTDPDGSWVDGSYDRRISAAVEALRSGGEAAEIIGDYEHVLIDEIQDLVGVRAQFVEAVLDATTGGFTLFGDPAQGIYGWQLDDADRTVESSPLISRLHQRFTDIQTYTLTRNHRAQTETAKGALWAGPLLNEPDPDYADIYSDLESSFFAVDELPDLAALRLAARKKQGTTAVLCRTNGIALNVSAELHDLGIQHRLQREATDRSLAPWLARVLGPMGPGPLTRTRFYDTWADAGQDPDGAEEAWRQLRRMDRRPGDAIEVARVVEQIRRGAAPDDLTVTPRSNLVVSTVHRAKGLEFDTVVIVDWPLREDMKTYELAEETRVLYVALSRARKDIFRVEQPEFFGWIGKQQWGDERWFHHGYEKWQRLGLEVRTDDIDRTRPFKGATPTTGAADIQCLLSSAVFSGDEVSLDFEGFVESDPFPRYTVIHKGVAIGWTSAWFGQCLHDELKLWRTYEVTRWPERITGLQVDGVDTVAGTAAATERNGLGDTGLFLRVRVCGLGRFEWPPKTETPSETPPMPSSVADWIARIQFLPKRQYAEALARARLNGGRPPTDPGTEWAAKVRDKLDRLLPR